MENKTTTTREEFEAERKRLFTKLFGQMWKDKPTWEYVRDGQFVSTPAFEGEEYRNAGKKVMIVGRALNGWDYDYGCCDSLAQTVDSVLSQNGVLALDTFIKKGGYDGDGRKRAYCHKNMRFFRFIKHIMEFIGESEEGIDENWFDDPKRWNQKFVWTNLFCIAPGEGGNPSRRFMKQGIDTYIELIALYVKYYSPDVVVFITGGEGWFDKLWAKTRSFADIINAYEECTTDNFIVATGNLGDSKIIVCNRPDRRGTTYEAVKEMAWKTAEHIKEKIK